MFYQKEEKDLQTYMMIYQNMYEELILQNHPLKLQILLVHNNWYHLQI